MNILKVIILIVVLTVVWLFLRSYVGNISINDIISGQRLEVTDAELWDEESPLSGSVILDIAHGANMEDPESEYLKLLASRSNDGVIDMTGWSIQSVVSDTRIYIPQATLMLKMKKGYNSLQKVFLSPGEYLILRTGHSPIREYAKSFHTNKCIGYLNQFIKFNPKIKLTCPKPDTILPATVANVRTYGSECIDFLANADRCTTYTTAMPANLLPVCRDLIARKLTYHACLSESFEKEGHDIFNNGGWYIYLGLGAEVWRNNYEAIRLLDADGKVVAVLRY
ncbi:MAG: hypothetical protein LRZ97_01650 [Candidatus Pacebacteria bacterium]|nr:hypothetical protein [Candidatus Paceibacterota bacterium]